MLMAFFTFYKKLELKLPWTGIVLGWGGWLYRKVIINAWVPPIAQGQLVPLEVMIVYSFFESLGLDFPSWIHPPVLEAGLNSLLNPKVFKFSISLEQSSLSLSWNQQCKVVDHHHGKIKV